MIFDSGTPTTGTQTAGPSQFTWASQQTPPTLTMPIKIAAAISEVMSTIIKLERDGRNQFASYNYASVDSFFDMLRPLMAKTGLSILTEELGFEIKEVITAADKGDRGGTRSLLFITFGFRFMHAAGEVWPQMPIKKTVAVAAGGAQAWGSAQSYALKQFARGQFMIATGEKTDDADDNAPVEVASVMTPTKAKMLVSLFVDDVAKATHASEVEDHFNKLRSDGGAMSAADKKIATAAYTAAILRLTKEEKPQ